jgi:hypothetical protein
VNAGDGLDEATTNIAAPARAGIAPADIMRKTMVILLIIQPRRLSFFFRLNLP